MVMEDLSTCIDRIAAVYLMQGNRNIWASFAVIGMYIQGVEVVPVKYGKIFFRKKTDSNMQDRL